MENANPEIDGRLNKWFQQETLEEGSNKIIQFFTVQKNALGKDIYRGYGWGIDGKFHTNITWKIYDGKTILITDEKTIDYLNEMADEKMSKKSGDITNTYDGSRSRAEQSHDDRINEIYTKYIKLLNSSGKFQESDESEDKFAIELVILASTTGLDCTVQQLCNLKEKYNIE